ncbi:hypothetical protein [Amycolatopsis sp. NPDC051716]|uniref:hypothetical protein n=1 Tax=Amycolatopsis sp. NPDC051716 TaxID=3155804 RepID=UPI003440930D
MDRNRREDDGTYVHAGKFLQYFTINTQALGGDQEETIELLIDPDAINDLIMTLRRFASPKDGEGDT